ncbi:PIN domain-containing protein [Slackia heliotrinireducens]|uniref:PIN domain-containing protein n=1 Tax=Slackia heliotrinireducens TaxID=84110 RepID=UPI003315BFC3
MKICFDANVVIDLFAQTDNVGGAVFSYDVANARRFDACVSASSLSDIAYVLHRRGLEGAKVNRAIEAMFDLFDVIDINGQDGIRALKSPMKDFEDALIAESCARCGVDCIVTRNTKDFRESPVQAMDPATFVEAFKPQGYHYSELTF